MAAVTAAGTRTVRMCPRSREPEGEAASFEAERQILLDEFPKLR